MRPANETVVVMDYGAWWMEVVMVDGRGYGGWTWLWWMDLVMVDGLGYGGWTWLWWMDVVIVDGRETSYRSDIRLLGHKTDTSFTVRHVNTKLLSLPQFHSSKDRCIFDYKFRALNDIHVTCHDDFTNAVMSKKYSF